MLDPARIPPVDSDELLARFVLFSKWVRNSDNTVKAEAFMPHPRVELSMTRHRQASVDEIWSEGKRIAVMRDCTLYGRADIGASVFVGQSLAVVPKPLLPENPNHADATGWPTEKPKQKIIAQLIAQAATYLQRPAIDVKAPAGMRNPPLASGSQMASGPVSTPETIDKVKGPIAGTWAAIKRWVMSFIGRT